MHLAENMRRNWHGGVEGELLIPLYWNIFMRGLGMGMLGLFIPLYIYLIGDLRLVAMYIVIQRGLIFLGGIEVTKIIEKIGFRYGVLLGSLFLMASLSLPAYFGSQVWVVVVMAILAAPSILFYWNSRLSIMSMDGQGERLGQETGMVHLLERGASVAAPALGGVVAQVFGFPVLFGVGVVIFFASCVPLFFMGHHKKQDHVSWRGFVSWLKEGINRGANIAFVGEAVDGMLNGFFWPIYFYLAVGTFEVLGGMTSIAMLASMVMAFWAGRKFDGDKLRRRRRFYGWGAILAVLRLGRAMFSSALALFGLDVATKMASANYYVPLDGYMYERSRRQEALEFYTYREMSLSLAMVIVAGVVWLIAGSIYFWTVMWAMAAVGVIMGLKMII